MTRYLRAASAMVRKVNAIFIISIYIFTLNHLDWAIDVKFFPEKKIFSSTAQVPIKESNFLPKLVIPLTRDIRQHVNLNKFEILQNYKTDKLNNNFSLVSEIGFKDKNSPLKENSYLLLLIYLWQEITKEKEREKNWTNSKETVCVYVFNLFVKNVFSKY